ncbi:MAG: class I SAM-dependent methyltransferase [Acidobacteriia bacterium]|nr:class I SAM-dependent methyltransferase [Terriglobia bacterium]
MKTVGVLPLEEPKSADIFVPDEIFEMAAQSVGAFFEPLCKVGRQANARDFLELSKSFKRAGILRRYVDLERKKVLEVGSGFGTNLAVWIRHFDADAYGVEPGGTGFNQGYIASRKLLAANGIDPDRVVDSAGESLPFPDESFDIVYSANVLEHTEDPQRVLMESLRVLRPGGWLHMELPNFLSYFEGHYMVVQPPILWKPMLAWWVRLVFRRDPAFARTLQTGINPIWCRRQVKKAGKVYPLELISLGEDLFLERLSQAFTFEMQMVASRAGGLIAALQRINRGNWAGRVIVALQGHYPIYLTLRKTVTQRASS